MLIPFLQLQDPSSNVTKETDPTKKPTLENENTDTYESVMAERQAASSSFKYPTVSRETFDLAQQIDDYPDPKEDPEGFEGLSLRKKKEALAVYDAHDKMRMLSQGKDTGKITQIPAGNYPEMPDGVPVSWTAMEAANLTVEDVLAAGGVPKLLSEEDDIKLSQNFMESNNINQVDFFKLRNKSIDKAKEFYRAYDPNKYATPNKREAENHLKSDRQKRNQSFTYEPEPSPYADGEYWQTPSGFNISRKNEGAFVAPPAPAAIDPSEWGYGKYANKYRLYDPLGESVQKDYTRDFLDLYGTPYTTLTPEQKATSWGYFMDGTEAKNIALHNMYQKQGRKYFTDEAGKEKVLVLGSNMMDGRPEWHAVDADKLQNSQTVRGLYGDREMYSTAMENMADQFIANSLDIGKIPGYVTDKIGYMSEVLLGGNAFGDALQNWGQHSMNSLNIMKPKISEFAMTQGPIDSWYGAAGTFAGLIPQLISQYGAARLLGAAGGYGLGFMLGAQSMNQAAVDAGITNKNHIALLSIMGGSAEMVSEMLVGKAIGATGFMENLGKKQIREQLKESKDIFIRDLANEIKPKLSATTTAKEASDAAKPFFQKYVGGAYNMMTEKLGIVGKGIDWAIKAPSKLGGEGKALIPNMIAVGFEESLEEPAASLINTSGQILYDYFLAESKVPGQGAFGAEMPTMHDLLGDAVAGFMGGTVFGAIRAFQTPQQEFKNLLFSNLAFFPGETEAERYQNAKTYIYELFENGELGNPFMTATDELIATVPTAARKNIKSKNELALEAALQQLDLAFATKRSLGLTSAEQVSKMMGGDSGLAIEAVRLAMNDQFYGKEVEEMERQLQDLKEGTAQHKVLNDKINGKKELMSNYGNRLTKILDGTLYSEYKASLSSNALLFHKGFTKLRNSDSFKSMSTAEKQQAFDQAIVDVENNKDFATRKTGSNIVDFIKDKGAKYVGFRDEVVKNREAWDESNKPVDDIITALQSNFNIDAILNIEQNASDKKLSSDQITALQKLIDDNLISFDGDLNDFVTNFWRKISDEDRESLQKATGVEDLDEDSLVQYAEALNNLAAGKKATSPDAAELPTIEKDKIKEWKEAKENNEKLSKKRDELNNYHKRNPNMDYILMPKSRTYKDVNGNILRSNLAQIKDDPRINKVTYLKIDKKNGDVSSLSEQDYKKEVEEADENFIYKTTTEPIEVVDHVLQNEDGSYSDKEYVAEGTKLTPEEVAFIKSINEFNGKPIDETLYTYAEGIAKNIIIPDANVIEEIDAITEYLNDVSKALTVLAGLKIDNIEGLLEERVKKALNIDSLETLTNKSIAIANLVVEDNIEQANQIKSLVQKIGDSDETTFRKYKTNKVAVMRKIHHSFSEILQSDAIDKDGNKITRPVIPGEATYLDVYNAKQYWHAYFNTFTEGRYSNIVNSDGTIRKDLLEIFKMFYPTYKDGSKKDYVNTFRSSGQFKDSLDPFNLKNFGGPIDNADVIFANKYVYNYIMSAFSMNMKNFHEDFKGVIDHYKDGKPTTRQINVAGDPFFPGAHNAEQISALEDIFAFTIREKRRKAESAFGAAVDAIEANSKHIIGTPGSGTMGNNVAFQNGSAGVGKTTFISSTSLKLARNKGIVTDDEILLVAPKDYQLKKLKHNVVNIGFGPTVEAVLFDDFYDNIDKYKNKIIVMDEYTLGDESKMLDWFQGKKSFAGNNIALILGDYMQASENPGGKQVEIASYVFGFNNLVNIMRSGVVDIAQYNGVIRTWNPAKGLPVYKTKALYYESNEQWKGLKFYDSVDEMKEDAKKRVNAGKAVVIVYDDIDAEDAESEGFSKDKIYVMNKSEKGFKSHGGMDFDEVFVYTNPSSILTREEVKASRNHFKRQYYTAVSRAKNFLGVIGEGESDKTTDIKEIRVKEFPDPDKKKQELFEEIDFLANNIKDYNTRAEDWMTPKEEKGEGKSDADEETENEEEAKNEEEEEAEYESQDEAEDEAVAYGAQEAFDDIENASNESDLTGITDDVNNAHENGFISDDELNDINDALKAAWAALKKEQESKNQNIPDGVVEFIDKNSNKKYATKENGRWKYVKFKNGEWVVGGNVGKQYIPELDNTYGPTNDETQNNEGTTNSTENIDTSVHANIIEEEDGSFHTSVIIGNITVIAGENYKYKIGGQEKIITVDRIEPKQDGRFYISFTPIGSSIQTKDVSTDEFEQNLIAGIREAEEEGKDDSFSTIYNVEGKISFIGSYPLDSGMSYHEAARLQNKNFTGYDGDKFEIEFKEATVIKSDGTLHHGRVAILRIPKTAVGYKNLSEQQRTVATYPIDLMQEQAKTREYADVKYVNMLSNLYNLNKGKTIPTTNVSVSQPIYIIKAPTGKETNINSFVAEAEKYGLYVEKDAQGKVIVHQNESEDGVTTKSWIRVGRSESDLLDVEVISVKLSEMAPDLVKDYFNALKSAAQNATREGGTKVVSRDEYHRVVNFLTYNRKVLLNEYNEEKGSGWITDLVKNKLLRKSSDNLGLELYVRFQEVEVNGEKKYYVSDSFINDFNQVVSAIQDNVALGATDVRRATDYDKKIGGGKHILVRFDPEFINVRYARSLIPGAISIEPKSSKIKKSAGDDIVQKEFENLDDEYDADYDFGDQQSRDRKGNRRPISDYKFVSREKVKRFINKMIDLDLFDLEFMRDMHDNDGERIHGFVKGMRMVVNTLNNGAITIRGASHELMHLITNYLISDEKRTELEVAANKVLPGADAMEVVSDEFSDWVEFRRMKGYFGALFQRFIDWGERLFRNLHLFGRESDLMQDFFYDVYYKKKYSNAPIVRRAEGQEELIQYSKDYKKISKSEIKKYAKQDNIVNIISKHNVLPILKKIVMPFNGIDYVKSNGDFDYEKMVDEQEYSIRLKIINKIGKANKKIAGNPVFEVNTFSTSKVFDAGNVRVLKIYNPRTDQYVEFPIDENGRIGNSTKAERKGLRKMLFNVIGGFKLTEIDGFTVTYKNATNYIDRLSDKEIIDLSEYYALDDKLFFSMIHNHLPNLNLGNPYTGEGGMFYSETFDNKSETEFIREKLHDSINTRENATISMLERQSGVLDIVFPAIPRVTHTRQDNTGKVIQALTQGQLNKNTINNLLVNIGMEVSMYEEGDGNRGTLDKFLDRMKKKWAQYQEILENTPDELIDNDEWGTFISVYTYLFDNSVMSHGSIIQMANVLKSFELDSKKMAQDIELIAKKNVTSDPANFGKGKDDIDDLVKQEVKRVSEKWVERYNEAVAALYEQYEERLEKHNTMLDALGMPLMDKISEGEFADKIKKQAKQSKKLMNSIGVHYYNIDKKTYSKLIKTYNRIHIKSYDAETHEDILNDLRADISKNLVDDDMASRQYAIDLFINEKIRYKIGDRENESNAPIKVKSDGVYYKDPNNQDNYHKIINFKGSGISINKDGIKGLNANEMVQKVMKALGIDLGYKYSAKAYLESQKGLNDFAKMAGTIAASSYIFINNKEKTNQIVVDKLTEFLDAYTSNSGKGKGTLEDLDLLRFQEEFRDDRSFDNTTNVYHPSFFSEELKPLAIRLTMSAGGAWAKFIYNSEGKKIYTNVLSNALGNLLPGGKDVGIARKMNKMNEDGLLGSSHHEMGGMLTNNLFERGTEQGSFLRKTQDYDGIQTQYKGVTLEKIVALDNFEMYYQHFMDDIQGFGGNLGNALSKIPLTNQVDRKQQTFGYFDFRSHVTLDSKRSNGVIFRRRDSANKSEDIIDARSLSYRWYKNMLAAEKAQILSIQKWIQLFQDESFLRSMDLTMMAHRDKMPVIPVINVNPNDLPMLKQNRDSIRDWVSFLKNVLKDTAVSDFYLQKYNLENSYDYITVGKDRKVMLGWDTTLNSDISVEVKGFTKRRFGPSSHMKYNHYHKKVYYNKKEDTWYPRPTENDKEGTRINDILAEAFTRQDPNDDAFFRALLTEYVFADELKNTHKLLEDLGYKKTQQGQVTQRGLRKKNGQYDEHWMGLIMAHAIANDSILLSMTTHAGFSDGHIDAFENGPIQAASNLNKRLQNLTSPGFRRVFDNEFSLSPEGRVLYVSDPEIAKSYYNYLSDSLHVDSIEATDGIDILSILDVVDMYRQHGEEFGIVNDTGQMKTINTQINHETGKLRLFKSSSIIPSKQSLEYMPQMRNFMQMMLNPTNHPSVSLWHKFLEFEEKMPFHEAASELYDFYIESRNFYKDEGIESPYTFINKIVFPSMDKIASVRNAFPYVDENMASKDYKQGKKIYEFDLMGETHIEHSDIMSAYFNEDSLKRANLTNFTEKIDLSQTLFQFDPNRPIDNSYESPFQQMLSIVLANPNMVATGKSKELDDLFFRFTEESMREMMHRFGVDNTTELAEKIMKDEMADYESGIFVERTTEDLELASAIEHFYMDKVEKGMLNANDDSVLSMLISEKDSGNNFLNSIDFAGVKTRAIQYLASYIRNEIIKQKLSGMRVVQSPGDFVQLVEYVEEDGSISYFSMEGARRHAKMLGVDFDANSEKPVSSGLQPIQAILQKREMTNIKELRQKSGTFIIKQLDDFVYDNDLSNLDDSDLEEINNINDEALADLRESKIKWLKERFEAIDEINLEESVESALDLIENQANMTESEKQVLKLLLADAMDLEDVDEAIGIVNTKFDSLKRAYLTTTQNNIYKALRERDKTIAKKGQILMPARFLKKYNLPTSTSLEDIFRVYKKDSGGKMSQVLFKKNATVENRAQLEEQIKMIIDDVLELQPTPSMKGVNIVYKKNSSIAEGDNIVLDAMIGKIEFDIKSKLKRKIDKLYYNYEAKNEKEQQKVRKKHYEIVDKFQSEVVERTVKEYADLVIGVNEMLNTFSVRTPSGPGSGYYAQVVGFVNDNGSVAYFNSAKNIIDGSDYDIDQITIYLKNITEHLVSGQNYAKDTLGNIANEIIQKMFDYYADPKNDALTRAHINLSPLKFFAQNAAKDVFNNYINVNGLGTSILYRVSTMGGKVVGPFALGQKVSTFMFTANVLNNNQDVFNGLIYNDDMEVSLNSLISITNGKNEKGVDRYYQVPIILESLVNAATDNPKLNLLGVVNVSFNNSFMVNAMVMMGDDVMSYMEQSRGKKYKDNISAILSLLKTRASKDIAKEVNKSSSIFFGSGRPMSMYAAAINTIKNIDKFGSENMVEHAKLTEQKDKYIKDLYDGLVDLGFNQYQIDKMFEMKDDIAIDFNIKKSSGLKWKMLKAVNLDNLKKAESDIEEADVLDSAGIKKEEDRQKVLKIIRARKNLIYVKDKMRKIEKWVDPQYRNDLFAISKYALYGEYVSKMTSIVNINQYNYTSEYDIHRYKKNAEFVTGVKFGKLMETFGRFEEYTLDNPNAKPIDFWNEVLSKEEEFSLKNRREFAFDQYKHSIASSEDTEENNTSTGSYFTDVIQGQRMIGDELVNEEINYMDQFHQIGNAIVTILSSRRQMSYMKAMALQDHSMSSILVTSLPPVKKAIEKMMDDAGIDYLNEYQFNTIKEEIDQVFVGKFLQHNLEGMGVSVLNVTLKRLEERFGLPVFGSIQEGFKARVNLNTVSGRRLFASILPSYFIDNIKDHLLKTGDISNSSKYFLKNLVLKNRNRVDYLAFEMDDYSIQPDDIARFREGFNNLPDDIKRVLNLYVITKDGFQYKKGNLAKVINTDYHKQYSRFLWSIKSSPNGFSKELYDEISLAIDDIASITQNKIFKYSKTRDNYKVYPRSAYGFARKFYDSIFYNRYNKKSTLVLAEMEDMQGIFYAKNSPVDSIDMGYESQNPLSIYNMFDENGLSLGADLVFNIKGWWDEVLNNEAKVVMATEGLPFEEAKEKLVAEYNANPEQRIEKMNELARDKKARYKKFLRYGINNTILEGSTYAIEKQVEGEDGEAKTIKFINYNQAFKDSYNQLRKRILTYFYSNSPQAREAVTEFIKHGEDMFKNGGSKIFNDSHMGNSLNGAVVMSRFINEYVYNRRNGMTSEAAFAALGRLEPFAKESEPFAKIQHYTNQYGDVVNRFTDNSVNESSSNVAMNLNHIEDVAVPYVAGLLGVELDAEHSFRVNDFVRDLYVQYYVGGETSAIIRNRFKEGAVGNFILGHKGIALSKKQVQDLKDILGVKESYNDRNVGLSEFVSFLSEKTTGAKVSKNNRTMNRKGLHTIRKGSFVHFVDGSIAIVAKTDKSLSKKEFSTEAGEMVDIPYTYYATAGSYSYKVLHTKYRGVSGGIQSNLESRLNAFQLSGVNISKRRLSSFVWKLSKVFPNISVKIVDNTFAEDAGMGNANSWIGKIDGVIYINKDKADKSVALHEFGHIYEMILREKYPKIHARLKRHLKGTRLHTLVNDIYGSKYNNNEDAIMTETIVTFLQNRYTDTVPKNVIDMVKTSIKRFFKKLYGIISRKGNLDRLDMSTATINDIADAMIQDMLEGRVISEISSQHIINMMPFDMQSRPHTIDTITNMQIVNLLGADPKNKDNGDNLATEYNKILLRNRINEAILSHNGIFTGVSGRTYDLSEKSLYRASNGNRPKMYRFFENKKFSEVKRQAYINSTVIKEELPYMGKVEDNVFDFLSSVQENKENKGLIYYAKKTIRPNWTKIKALQDHTHKDYRIKSAEKQRALEDLLNIIDFNKNLDVAVRLGDIKSLAEYGISIDSSLVSKNANPVVVIHNAKKKDSDISVSVLYFTNDNLREDQVSRIGNGQTSTATEKQGGDYLTPDERRKIKLVNNNRDLINSKAAIQAMGIKQATRLKSGKNIHISKVGVIGIYSDRNSHGHTAFFDTLHNMIDDLNLLYNHKSIRASLDRSITRLFDDALINNKDSHKVNFYEALRSYAVSNMMNENGTKNNFFFRMNEAIDTWSNEYKGLYGEELSRLIYSRMAYLRKVHSQKGTNYLNDWEYKLMLDSYKDINDYNRFKSEDTKHIGWVGKMVGTLDRRFDDNTEWITMELSNALWQSVDTIKAFGKKNNQFVIELNNLMKVTSPDNALKALYDNARGLFEPMYIKRKAYHLDKEGKLSDKWEMVNVNEIHWDINHPETRAALADPNSKLTEKHVEYGKFLMDSFEEEMVQYFYHKNFKRYESVSKDNEVEDIKEGMMEMARQEVRRVWRKGWLPAMPRAASEAFSQKDYKDAFSLFMDAVNANEGPTEQFYIQADPITAGRFKDVDSHFWKQFVSNIGYGSKSRLHTMGLDMVGDKLVVVDASNVRNQSYNLQTIGNFTMISSARTRAMSKVIDAANVAMDLMEVYKNNSSVDTGPAKDILKNYIMKNVYGQINKLGPLYFEGHIMSLDSILNGLGKATTYIAMAFSPLLSLKNAASSSLKAITNSSANKYTHLFDREAYTQAWSEFMNNREKVLAINHKYQIVSMDERDVVNHVMYNKTQQHLMEPDVAMIGHFAGDHVNSLIGMVAQMIKDGVYDAHDNDGNYDYRKDKRFKVNYKWNDDGTSYEIVESDRITKDGETLLEHHKIKAIKENKYGQTIDKDLQGAFVAADIKRYKVIIQRYISEITSNEFKSDSSANAFANTVMLLKNYMRNVAQELLQQSQPDVALANFVVKDGKTMRMAPVIEGATITWLKSMKMMMEYRGNAKKVWENMTPWQKRNMYKAIPYAVGIGSVYAGFLLLDAILFPDEEDKQGYMYSAYMMLKTSLVGAANENIVQLNPYKLISEFKKSPNAILMQMENYENLFGLTIAMMAYPTMSDDYKKRLGIKTEKDFVTLVDKYLYAWSKTVPYGAAYRDVRRVSETIINDLLTAMESNAEQRKNNN